MCDGFGALRSSFDLASAVPTSNAATKLRCFPTQFSSCKLRFYLFAKRFEGKYSLLERTTITALTAELYYDSQSRNLLRLCAIFSA